MEGGKRGERERGRERERKKGRGSAYLCPSSCAMVKAVASPISSLILQLLPVVHAPRNSAIPDVVNRERGKRGEGGRGERERGGREREGGREGGREGEKERSERYLVDTLL